MYTYNIHLELQMEIEEKYVVSYLHRKGIKLSAIVAGLAAVYHAEAFDENIVKYWLHEIKLHHFDLHDRPNSGRPPLEDIDARILQVLEAEPWAVDTSDLRGVEPGRGRLYRGGDFRQRLSQSLNCENS
jgi:hypothetical protein